VTYQARDPEGNTENFPLACRATQQTTNQTTDYVS